MYESDTYMTIYASLLTQHFILVIAGCVSCPSITRAHAFMDSLHRHHTPP